jgi:hypothetical protein
MFTFRGAVMGDDTGRAILLPEAISSSQEEAEPQAMVPSWLAAPMMAINYLI